MQTSEMIRAEIAHAINGVKGRLQNLRKPPAPWKDGVFANQKWTSESRPVKGFGTNGQMSVQIRFDDECKNGHNTFSITAEIMTAESRRRRDIAAGGCMHEDIAKVFPELAHLIKWHLVSTDGPMHYVGNTIYHASQNGANWAFVYFTGPADPLGIAETKEKLLGYVEADKAKEADGMPGYRVEWDEKTVKVANYEHARSSACWPEATDEQLSLPKNELQMILENRLPALLADFRRDVENAGFVWSC